MCREPCRIVLIHKHISNVLLADHLINPKIFNRCEWWSFKKNQGRGKVENLQGILEETRALDNTFHRVHLFFISK